MYNDQRLIRALGLQEGSNGLFYVGVLKARKVFIPHTKAGPGK